MIDKNKAFYEACSQILRIPHEYSVPVKRRTRWNTRLLGNGRFPGFGLVRCYGDLVIIVARTGTVQFSTHQKALDYLKSLEK